MEIELIYTYCLADSLTKSFRIVDDVQCKLSTPELVTFAIASARFFQGNHRFARRLLLQQGYFKGMLSPSQLCRRLHALPPEFWMWLFHQLGRVFVACNGSLEYIVDSFPVHVCDNARISRCRIFREKSYHGYAASKKRYLYGLKVHMITTRHGQPVELLFTPASENDVKALKRFELDLPEGSVLYGDRAYNSYDFEDLLLEATSIRLVAQRRRNSTRFHDGCLAYLQNRGRKRIETTFSQIIGTMPRHIHAVTKQGFELKLLCFVLAYSFSCFAKLKSSFA